MFLISRVGWRLLYQLISGFRVNLDVGLIIRLLLLDVGIFLCRNPKEHSHGHNACISLVSQWPTTFLSSHAVHALFFFVSFTISFQSFPWPSYSTGWHGQGAYGSLLVLGHYTIYLHVKCLVLRSRRVKVYHNNNNNTARYLFEKMKLIRRQEIPRVCFGFTHQVGLNEGGSRRWTASWTKLMSVASYRSCHGSNGFCFIFFFIALVSGSTVN